MVLLYITFSADLHLPILTISDQPSSSDTLTSTYGAPDRRRIGMDENKKDPSSNERGFPDRATSVSCIDLDVDPAP